MDAVHKVNTKADFSAKKLHRIYACLFSQRSQLFSMEKIRACLKNHSRNLYAPLCGIFCPNSVAVARYGALIRTKSPTKCDAHLAESLFQTRSRAAKEG